MGLADNLRLYRELKKLSKAQLAGEARLARERIHDLEKGKGNPTLKTLSALALALEIEVSQLIKAEHNKQDIR